MNTFHLFKINVLLGILGTRVNVTLTHNTHQTVF